MITKDLSPEVGARSFVIMEAGAGGVAFGCAGVTGGADVPVS
jgi:hypothetical protein